MTGNRLGMFLIERHDDGVAVVTMDDPDQSVNTANERFLRELPLLLDHLEGEGDSLTGVVLTSAKKTFFAGADLAAFAAAGPGDLEWVAGMLDELKVGFRRVELLGVPVVAAINGTALGGGCELALACHHRIATSAKGVVIGLPEVSLGLLAGAGGVTRTARMLGVMEALDTVLLPGTHFAPSEAFAAGLVDEVVDPDDLVDAARRWLSTRPAARQPWDEPGYRIPHGAPRDARLAASLTMLPARLRKSSRGAPIEAVQAIVATAVEGAQLDFDGAQAVETRYCSGLVCGQTSTNIIKGTFFDVRAVRKSTATAAGPEPRPIKQVLVIGDGRTGADVARLASAAGINAVLVDRPGLVMPDAVDLIFETVLDNRADRWNVLQEVAAIVPSVPVAVNTSETSLAELSMFVDPARLVGLHLFTPVRRMKLAEIAVQDSTPETACAAALTFARALGKTSIIVGDAPGFYANQVLVAFLTEALRMLADGVPAPSVEQAAFQAGFPAGALALIDEISLDGFRVVAARVGRDGSVPDSVLAAVLGADQRPGRTEGGGFYNYADGRRTGLWTGLEALFSPRAPTPLRELMERLLFAGALAAERCLSTRVLRSVPEGNVGSLLGIGFPTWTGGALQFIDQYRGGVQGFVDRAQELAESNGARFLPSPELRERAGATSRDT